MAANDYYTNSFSPNAPHNPTSSHQQTGTTAPANQSQYSISPVTSPFDDRNRYDYPSSSQQHLASGGAAPAGHTGYSDTAYNGAASRYDPPAQYGQNGDPFADQNAIPLQNHDKMGGHHMNTYGADPENHIYHKQPEGSYLPGKKRKKGFLKGGKITWVVYILTTVQIGVFIGEIVRNAVLTKTPIQIKPQFNYMIGPSYYVTINMGARFQPCMHSIPKVTDVAGLAWFCPNTTSTREDDNKCNLQQICGMGGGVPLSTGNPAQDGEPNQWWRFITPIFLHAGLIHLGFNMLLQCTLGRDMEKELGSIRFFLVYFSAGVFGNVLGGNYAAANKPSMGASGALFGVLALVLLDLLYNWQTRRSPVKDLLFLLLDFAIAFVLGLLPFLDNFAHIGGFLMGLVLGICLMHSPQALRERIGTDDPPYATVDNAPANGKPAIAGFVKQPVGFFKGRKPFWWAWWLVRAASLVAVFIGFILLLRNFYEWRNKCSWCHRLSCLPVNDWCNPEKFDIVVEERPEPNPNKTGTTKMVRDLAMLGGVDLTPYL